MEKYAAASLAACFIIEVNNRMYAKVYVLRLKSFLQASEPIIESV
jgi:hypothetical protein